LEIDMSTAQDYYAAFEEGQQACIDGLSAVDNPYADWPGALRSGWKDGYIKAIDLRAEWEDENHQRAYLYS
jgi:hypothetical protein